MINQLPGLHDFEDFIQTVQQIEVYHSTPLVLVLTHR